jgi:hypothetical protein
MLDALSIMMPSARSARQVPERSLYGLGIASSAIGHVQQPVPTLADARAAFTAKTRFDIDWPD